VKVIKMKGKTKATLIFPFLYLISPLVALSNGKDIQTVNERMWIELNRAYDEDEEQ